MFNDYVGQAVLTSDSMTATSRTLAIEGVIRQKVALCLSLHLGCEIGLEKEHHTLSIGPQDKSMVSVPP